MIKRLLGFSQNSSEGVRFGAVALDHLEVTMEANSKNILVLGASGTTGREVSRALVQRGATVRAATRDPRNADLPAGVMPVRLDLDDDQTWSAALAGVEGVYFVMPPFRADEVEIGRRLIRAATQAGVKRIVKLSASGVDAVPDSPHLLLEQAIEATGLEYVHIRPTFFIDNFVNNYGYGIANDGVIALPAGDGRSSFVAASDIGDVVAEALLGATHGETWTLTGGESLTHAEVAAILSDVLEREIRFVDITPEEHVAGMEAFGMPPLGQEVMRSIYGFVRAGYTGSLSPTVEQVLGRKPVTLREWAQRHRSSWEALA